MATSLLARTLALGALCAAIAAFASPVRVTVDTSALTGKQADLAFDLLDGGTPANTVTISGFTTDGTLGVSSSTGDVTGAFPGPVTLADTSFFSEYLQPETLGTTFSFVFDTTGNAPNAASFPDGFSLFLLDPATGLSLVTTSDPTQADALFLLNIGTSTLPDVYTSDSVTVSAAAVPSLAPEPSTLPLTIVAIAGIILLTTPRPRTIFNPG